MSRLADAMRRAGQLRTDEGSRTDELATSVSQPANLGAADPAASADLRVEGGGSAGAPDEAAERPLRAEPHAVPPQGSGVMAMFQGFNPDIAEKLVVTTRFPLMSLEQYRNLAATLHHTQAERGIKVVMVASALGSEGKTLTAVNLALTLSGSYRREVLLIDADLRRPSLHQAFQVPNTSGLSDALKSETERKVSAIQISSSLALVTAGPPVPDPMTMLTSERIRRLLVEAASRFDWVIIDTPPVGLLTDANLLATMVDVGVLVVRAGHTPCRLIQRAIDTIGRDRIIGVVLNGVESRLVAGANYYPAYYAAQSSPQ